MSRLILRILQLLFISLYRLVGSSIRIIENPIPDLRAMRGSPDRSIVFAIWHEFSVFGMYWYRRRNAGGLVDDSFRGDILAGVLNHFGIRDFRANTRRPGSQARHGVPALIRHIREGHDGLVAMDGPFGPARIGKPGIVHIAGRSNALIIPVGVYFSHAYEVKKRWDNYQVPLPWSRLHIVLGAPIEVPSDFRKRQGEIIERLNAATNEATEEARRRGRMWPVERRRRRRGGRGGDSDG